MNKSRTFEELPVWRKARKLTMEIYAAAKQKPFCFDKGLVDQITRAAVSVMSNIAEGLERGTTNELIYFLFIAKGSAGEVRAQLYVAEDQGYISSANANILREDAKTISIQLSSWVKSMQTLDAPKGPQHHIEPEKESEFTKKMNEWRKNFELKLKNGEI